ncbi:MAG: DUF1847 domain-containing protein [Actinobacteria bacterium]|nr:DUF1847 domain-containing protein [Actinomycetota bacterium]
MYTCAECAKESCVTGDLGSSPLNCPSREPDAAAALSAYRDDVAGELARTAARVEAGGYCRLTRIEEIMDFARRCGHSHLGLAFCVGLHHEAAVVSRILRANGFTVDSVACKNGALPKEEIGLTDQDKLDPGEFESMCNPIGQGRALARAGTELNVMLGLCVGHDSLFMMNSEAPVTVLAVKDRVLGHNPLAAVYLADGYYCDKLFPQDTASPVAPDAGD